MVRLVAILALALATTSWLVLSGSGDPPVAAPSVDEPVTRTEPTVVEAAGASAPETPAMSERASAGTEELLVVIRSAGRPLDRFKALEALRTAEGAVTAYRAVLLELLHDADTRVRRWAICGLQGFARKDRDVVRALFALAGDTDPRVRRDVTSVLGGVAGVHPEARAVVLRAMEDESREVRETAVWFLGNIGEEGARIALESLSGDWSDDALDDLTMVVVEFGLMPEALEREPSAKVKELLLLELCEDAWDHPEFAIALRGRYRDLIDDFVPDHNHGWKEFFETAEDGGDGWLIRDVALDRKRPDAVRAGAVGATVRREDGGREFIDLAGRLLAEPGASEALRLAMVEHFETFRGAHPERRDEVREILRELARTDASPVVRKAAKDGAN